MGLGYVNWNASHDVLKTQRWIKLSTISECIKQMERFWIFNSGQERLKRLSTSSVLVAVSEVKRFPKSGAFVNIYCPHVSAELHSLTTQPKPEFMPGLLQRFNDNCRDDIHTFSSFEEKYQLKWVD